MTVLIAHCMAFVPSYGGAAPALMAVTSTTTTSPIRVARTGLAA